MRLALKSWWVPERRCCVGGERGWAFPGLSSTPVSTWGPTGSRCLERPEPSEADGLALSLLISGSFPVSHLLLGNSGFLSIKWGQKQVTTDLQ